MLARGTRYDRKLTLQGFFTAMTKNESNFILMGQGFFANIPWGVIFVFLNDFLSQEKGMSVPDATLLVFFFGVGCALGGVLGGYWGQLTTQINRSYMPLFMAATTFLGIFPFLGLLDGAFDRANTATIALSLSGGLIANLPSVNVRPCLINVNPPETRGAALTAANLIINFARGCGPSFITMMGGIWQVDRQYSFNVTVRILYDYPTVSSWPFHSTNYMWHVEFMI
jgi:translation initiation factor 4G